MKKVALKRNLSILSKRRWKNNQKPNEKARKELTTQYLSILRKRRLKNNQKPNEKARKELTTQNGQIKRRRKRKETDHRKKERKQSMAKKKKKKKRRKKKKKKKKAYSTRYSQAVTHPSTNLARRCLTSVIGREPVFSTWYGRRHLTHSFTPTYTQIRQHTTPTLLPTLQRTSTPCSVPKLPSARKSH